MQSINIKRTDTKCSNMENSASAFPDWAHLPLDVVHLVSEKIKCITDYVRFHAVCSPWRSASLPKPVRHLPHQLPWLMIPFSIRHSNDDGIRLFYDLWESKMRKIHLPETIDKMCCASYRGWLLVVAPHGTELFLLNPLTWARVQLPPFTIPVKRIWDGDEDDDDDEDCKVDFLVDFLFKKEVTIKVTFSADLTDLNCVIMVFFPRSWGPFFCKVRDCCWTEVVWPIYLSALIDAVYCNGNFFLLTSATINIYDPNQLKMQDTYFFKPKLEDAFDKFFLEGKSGIYIVGGEQAKVGTAKVPKQKLKLYKFIYKGQRMKLKWIADTSDTAIFYGDNCNYFAVRADKWDSLDGGCMYMPYICSLSPSNKLKLYKDPDEGCEHGSCYSTFCCKLDDGKPKLVISGFGEIPQIWPSRPALWFQPTFV